MCSSCMGNKFLAECHWDCSLDKDSRLLRSGSSSRCTCQLQPTAKLSHRKGIHASPDPNHQNTVASQLSASYLHPLSPARRDQMVCRNNCIERSLRSAE